ncbi:MAG TPA: pyridoxamine 5'-phosphate oxidase family protein [Pyrinomonadaceae bacterium]|jgi:nitroimidazol reductase NimA-like FMN-containing flavoprotein (pyridoxamine 5'-phosphate oxidase superfamily)
MENFEPTAQTTLKRLPKRGHFERETVYSILDEGFICHVGFVVDGRPFVIPTGYGRTGDRLYIHGSAASRMLRTLREGVDVCVTVTLVDGLVLARSSFHHSMNYRSVVVFGRAEVVEDEDEKMEALRVFTDHVMRGRWEDARLPNKSELRQTLVLALPLAEASAKIRTGPPIDDEEDYELPVWAGELPLRLVTGEAIADPRLHEGVEQPQYMRDYKRPQADD